MFEPRDPDFAARVQRSFDKQGLMTTLGASLAAVAPGSVDIVLVPRPQILQQHGFVHAGALAAILDTACGYAALTLFPPGVGVLTTEFKINLMAPAKGARIVAEGRVKRAGQKLCVCLGEAFAEDGDSRKPVALMTASMMVVDHMDIVD